MQPNPSTSPYEREQPNPLQLRDEVLRNREILQQSIRAGYGSDFQSSSVFRGRSVFDGNQYAPGLISVSQDSVQRVIRKLNESSPKGVGFRPLRGYSPLEEVTCSGGTCTAMALSFAQDALKVSTGNLDQLPLSKLKGKYFSDSTRDLEGNNRTFAVQQLALNTLYLKEIPKLLSKQIDSFELKAQALAMAYGFSCKRVGDELVIDYAEQFFSALQELLESLPDGVFLVRVILPINSKGEELWGHSCILIREGKSDIFYDPNYGAARVSTYRSYTQMWANLIHIHQEFAVTHLGLFQLTPCSRS